MNYDFEKFRFYYKGTLQRWSEYAAGCRTTQARLLDGETVTLSAAKVSTGKIFYFPCSPNPKPAGPGVLWRVRVKLKPQHVRRVCPSCGGDCGQC